MNGKTCDNRPDGENEDDEFGFKKDTNQSRKSSIGDYMNLAKPSAIFVEEKSEALHSDVSHIEMNSEEKRRGCEVQSRPRKVVLIVWSSDTNVD